MPLTDLEIRRSKPREKSYTLNDGNGLSLLIEPNGSRGWRFRYRFDGKPKMISLGTYPDVTLNDARLNRDDARKQVPEQSKCLTHFFASLRFNAELVTARPGSIA